jgi:Flp pilus assembly protein TadD
VYLQTSQFADAAQQFEKARKSTSGHPAATAGLAAALAHSKKKADGKKLLLELEKLAEKSEGIRYYLAVAWLAFGDTSRALRCLEKACDERSVSIPNIGIDPALDSIRTNPGFKKVLNRAGLNSR